jgi:hypothetical protein
MRIRVPRPEERYLVFANKRTVESISEDEARFKHVSFGCNGSQHAREVLYEIYSQQGEGDIVDVDSTPVEIVGNCDDSCGGNIESGRRGWFALHS